MSADATWVVHARRVRRGPRTCAVPALCGAPRGHGCRAVPPEDPPGCIVRVPHGYTDPDQVRSDLQAGGLRPERLDRVVLRGRAASARVVAEGFSLGSPLRSALQERGSLDALTQALGDEITARLGPGPVESDLAAFVVSARRPD